MEEPVVSQRALTAGTEGSSGCAGEELERLAHTVAQLEDELIAAQKLAALGSMSAMIAHELNNLMTPAVNWADLALRDPEPSTVRRSVERVKTQLQRAINLVQHLLALAKGEDLPNESCSVAQAVQAAIATATRPFEKDGITLSIAVPEDLRVKAHPDLLVQVLLNLLLNARTAMKSQRGTLSVTARRDGGMVLIDVRDSGVGLSREQLDEVINPFLAGEADDERAWKAVGLGLNVCRLIARKHGAAIRALANPDRGCTFRLCWPAG